MTLRIDPEKAELKVLQMAVDWHGRRVLEIGCGDGRLARRLVRLGARVVGTDPDGSELHRAQSTRPMTYRMKLAFAGAQGEQLPFKARSFDIVVFGWSL